MNISSRGVWQISGGSTSRSYADVFLKYGVALLGPGDAGPWRPDRSDENFNGSFVRRFASEVQVGDILLLRARLATIIAVGIVASEYLYLEAFDDVSGWDLQHARRVHWYALPEPYNFHAPVFGANPPRLSRISNGEVLDYAQRFVNSPPTLWQTAPLPALPEEEPVLEEVPTSLRELVAATHDLLPLWWDSEAFGDPPSENEMVAHFVVPFLRALGWPPELIALQWRRIDVAVFRALPRTPENCRLVIEAKRLGAGIEEALEQAKGYVQALGQPCDTIVTDGIRYRLYSYEKDFAPVAYANLARLKQSAEALFTRLKRL